MSYYTSFETSVALRDAGAVQTGAEKAWYLSATRDGEPRLINATDGVCEIRAFRLDEILEALAEATWQADRGVRVDSPSGCVDEWSVTVETTTSRRRKRHAKGEDVSRVEAAAACYLAVLRAAREAKP